MNEGKYVDSESCVQLIGCAMSDPSLMDDDGAYFYNEDDFTSEFHKVVFGAIYNLYIMGATHLDVKTIDSYLKDRPKSYAVFKNGNGQKWLMEAMENADLNNFDYYYNRVKKMTLLRGYIKVGLDVSWLLDMDNIFDLKKRQSQLEYFDSLSLEEVADKLENRILNIRSTYVDNSIEDGSLLGDGIEKLVTSLEETPDVGAPGYGDLVNAITRGQRLGRFYIRSAATGVGKALPNSTVIPTPNGQKTVGEIQTGDYLFDAFGKPTKVLGVFPQGQREVWEITFMDGRKAKCSKDHLWSYCTRGQKPHSRKNRKFYTKTLEEISNMEIHSQSQGYRILIPQQHAVEYTTKEYYIPPYSFGALIGDGSFRYNNTNKALTFSSDDKEIVEILADEMGYNFHKNSGFNYGWTFQFKDKDKRTDQRVNVWVEEILKDYPVLWNTKSETKFIPRKYLEGDINQRLDLLNGLLDTDGSIDKEKGRVSYFTVSPFLKNNVIELCESLGFKATYSIDNHKDSLPLYCIHISGSPEQKTKLFKLKRKKDRLLKWLNNGKMKKSNDFNAIFKIKKLNYSEEMTCFLVDNKEHLFLMNDFIVTHNTRTMVADFLNTTCSKIWKNGEWIDNGPSLPSMFISTELEIDELQTLAISFIADINEDKILSGKLDFDEKERVKEAINIFKDAPAYVYVVPDFGIKDIENLIKRNIRTRKIRYIYYDYLHSSMKIISDVARASGGMKLREDLVLFLLAVKLKEIATTFNVFIITSTQLNASWKTDDIPDQNLLRASKAIADKADIGEILLNVTQNDLDKLENVLTEEAVIPNIKMSIYKNRRGKYTNCFLWMKANKATSRFDGLFLTNWNYELIPIEELNIDTQLL